MLDVALRLDEALDRLNAGLVPAAETDLDELVGVARLLRELPAEAWPDHTFPCRLRDALAADLAHGAPARRPRRRRRLLPALAAAAAIVVAIAVVLSERTPTVSAATLAREALAASSGAVLSPVQFTQVTVNTAPKGEFEPVPPPPRVLEHVTFADAEHWRVDATITQPNDEGTATVETVRNGDTIVTVRTSPAEGKTETRRPAGAGAGLPTAAAYGAQVDPLTLLAQSQGRCGRAFGPVEEGPTIGGRPTLVLRIGATPCPSSDTGDQNGPARFVVDRDTHLVLRADVHDGAGALTQRVETTALETGATVPSEAFRLPAPLPKAPAPSGELAFTPVLPTDLPDGLRAGPVTPVSTQASTGKTLSFTVTYSGADGRALLQLYEAAATTPSVRFPGRSVPLRPGVTGTLYDAGGMQILWWLDDGRYLSLQQGGQSAGVQLAGTYSTEALVAIARSAK
jgi:hypothetical protein